MENMALEQYNQLFLLIFLTKNSKEKAATQGTLFPYWAQYAPQPHQTLGAFCAQRGTKAYCWNNLLITH
jgi:hypothetical protein